MEKISLGLAEQQQIIERLKRYEDLMYGIVARRLAVLRKELAAISRSLSEESE
ncbi:MAG: hypothetical protein ACE5K9_03465 [Candidatus Methylomirabilales bacterium]